MREDHTFKKSLEHENAAYQIELELTPDEYAAIGRVSAQWAFLEYHVSLFCIELTTSVGIPMNKDFESDSFRKRKRAWQALVELMSPDDDPNRLSMLEIIRRTGDLQGQRQFAIHSAFEWDENDKTKLHGYSHKNPGGHPRSHDVESLNALAEKIAELNAAFLMWPDDFPTPPPGFAKYRHISWSPDLKDFAPGD